jgi:hypothetical protein
VNRNDVLTERYEELRKKALGRRQEGMAWGLVVLRTKGIASWTRAWQEYAEDVPSKASGVSPFSSTSDDMVRVLAGMVWAVNKEDR